MRTRREKGCGKLRLEEEVNGRESSGVSCKQEQLPLWMQQQETTRKRGTHERKEGEFGSTNEKSSCDVGKRKRTRRIGKKKSKSETLERSASAAAEVTSERGGGNGGRRGRTVVGRNEAAATAGTSPSAVSSKAKRLLQQRSTTRA
jgi:hypothetical protein